ADTTVLEEIKLSAAAHAQLIKSLHQAHLYEISVPAYKESFPASKKEVADLLSAAATLWQSFNQKISAADKKLEQATSETNLNSQVSLYLEAGKAILGEAFLILPRFKYINPEDVTKVLADGGDQLLKYSN